MTGRIDVRSLYIERAVKHGIPEHCLPGLVDYIVEGIDVGGFLTAVLENDLERAVVQADDRNLRVLHRYVRFLANEAPRACWGSRKRVDDWIERQGLGRALNRMDTTATGGTP